MLGTQDFTVRSLWADPHNFCQITALFNDN